MDPDTLVLAEPNASQHPVVRIGVTVGVGLCVLFLVWLFVANHISFLDRFALIRNLVAAGIGGILLLVPICRFPSSPIRLFASALIAWTMLAFTYTAAEVRFPVLNDRLGAFHLFILGTTAYGLLAAAIWVGRCVKYACRHPIAARRRNP